jgi:hypothetical protein
LESVGVEKMYAGMCRLKNLDVRVAAAGVLCHFAVWCVLLVHSGRNIDAIMLKANGVFLEQSEAGKATEYEPARITSKNNISAFIQGKIVAACIRGGVATAKSVDC